MYYYEKQIGTTIELLKNIRTESLEEIPYSYIETEYKENNILPTVTDEWISSAENNKLEGFDKHFWIYAKVKTPEKVEGKKIYIDIPIIFDKDDAINPQCILYVNNEIRCGLDINHRECELEFDKEYDIYIYYYSGTNRYYKTAFEMSLNLLLLDEKVNELYYDLDVPHKVALCYKENDKEFLSIIKYLANAVNILDLCNIGSKDFYSSVEESLSYMHKEFYGNFCNRENPVVVNGIGHTHIDVAWLWTYSQTKEKVQRSFSTVLMLMEKYPEYKFMSSQPQLYKFLKEEAPDIYKKVKEKIQEGRWEVEGGMWLEADCNLISGESMVRQFLHGKKFIKDEFNKDSTILWLPDVFGYSAAMPQIMKKCGINKFFTSKISWNELNKMPYDTFYWQGIDGTEIFSYFATAQDYKLDKEPENFTTYVALLQPAEVKGTWERYQQKEYNNEVISTFGYGDGGGGPTSRMLETQRRLSYGIPGMPKTQIDFAGDSLERIKNNFDANSKLLREIPKWCGELYLEYHRGTYTNVAKNKRFNRKCELLYQYAEAISTFDMILNNGYYDSKKLYDNWELILLNQFHDVIPGTSIKEVYEDTDKIYDKLFYEGEDIVNSKLTAISNNVDAVGGIVVFNPTGFVQSGSVNVEGKDYYCVDVPAFGWKYITESEQIDNISIIDNHIENKYFILTLDDNGNIKSLYDKRVKKEVFNDVSNQFELYEDRPYCWDGWEVSYFHKHKCKKINNLRKITKFSNGFSAGFILKRSFSNSVIYQKIIMYSDKDRIDFETRVDWNENNMLLKVAFPVNVFATKATYDIQFGNIERPTHENTSWEKAKFEVCGHKWADISDYSYGVSLLNDCKYGHSVNGSVMHLSLIKAANYPNPQSDRGTHIFNYSIYPHIGDFRNADTVKEAYQLNNPLRTAKAGGNGNLPICYAPVKCSSGNIVIDTIKKSEKGNNVVVRAYEFCNSSLAVTLNFGFDIKRAYLCDMLENVEREIPVQNNSINVEFSNFEVVTVMLER